MIYFVDDDVNQMRPFREELQANGYEVTELRNADEALDCLKKANDIELIIMDVMLGTGPKETSKFSMEETNGFLTTGLILIDRLTDFFSGLISSDPLIKHKDLGALKNRLVIFSMTHQQEVIKEITKRVEKNNINHLRKSDYADPYDFYTTLINITHLGKRDLVN
jgi:CheY-like chemotaxis protein